MSIERIVITNEGQGKVLQDGVREVGPATDRASLQLGYDRPDVPPLGVVEAFDFRH